MPELPFEQVTTDIMGPVEKSAAGYQYILFLLDYETSYPEVVPMQAVTAPKSVGELLTFFTRVD